MQEVTFDFRGKNYAVLGASSGIGRQVALELSRAGAGVLAMARSEERLAELKSQCPGTVETAHLDVTSAPDDEWDSILAGFANRQGKLNGAVYTAGITGCTPLKMYDKELAQDMMDISLRGGIQLIHHVSKKKYSAAGASYVIFSSVAAYEGPKGILFYAAAKGAVQSAVRVMSKEISHRDQRINSISPGWIKTEMTASYLESVGANLEDAHAAPLGIGTPEDVSGLVLFLLSDRAGWITGQDFIVDGGYLSTR
ncbi:SDR family oxidoreductase [Anaerovibrio lipolyticus]|uniref:SDR family NAD(P)-dependent oxidoreductase n=1 Tax=Anaerovibrio lipolyticus TaxID=82374 RepID=UPI0023F2AE9A|nr:SDR family oxidoreductase [Anaerovibrio lipolyticus]